MSFKFKFFQEKLEFILDESGYFSIKDLIKKINLLNKISFEIKLKEANFTTKDFDKIETSIKKESAKIKISISFYNNLIKLINKFTLDLKSPQIEISQSIVNLSLHPIIVRDFILFHVKNKILGGNLKEFFEMEKSPFYFYKFGWQSWSPAFIINSFKEYKNLISFPLNHPALSREELISVYKNKHNLDFNNHSLASEWTGVLKYKNNYLTCGFLTMKEQFTQIELKKEKEDFYLEAKSSPLAKNLLPGEHLFSEKLFLDFSPLALALENYAEKSACEMKAPHNIKALKGWCSWYYYFTKVAPQDIFKNLNFLSHHPEIKLDFIQIDDGFQKNLGAWEENKKFFGKLKDLAKKIKTSKFMPGIWIAPFLVSENSLICKKHFDWLIKDNAGKPALAIYNWGRKNYGLDPAHPEVQNYLEELFKYFLKIGFEYFKLDFLYAGAMPGNYFNQTNRIQAYRKGIEIIREILKDKFILGCGAPLGASIGIFNACRVSPDTALHWESLDPSAPSAFNSLRNNILRLFIHKHWWINDPDCLILKKERTSLTSEQFKAMHENIKLTQGMLVISEDLTKLGLEELSLMKKIFYSKEIPSIALLKKFVPEYFKFMKK
ncbi:MAG: alpha-galactosidase [Armatimonadetes bacterium]|nr:alpha-galactosidase [Armatimonadota bacterium]